MPKLVQSQSLPKLLEDLRASSTALNQVTDDAANLVKQVENFLNKECSVGIPAQVNVEWDDDREEGVWLEYRRVGANFRIALVSGDPGDENPSVRPWSDCTREEKLESIGKLPELISSISENVNKKLAESKDAIAKLSDLLHGIMKED